VCPDKVSVIQQIVPECAGANSMFIVALVVCVLQLL
jgi:hypothetical protein